MSRSARRRGRSAASQLDQVAESRSAADEIEIEIVDDSGAVTQVENPDQEIIVEHAEDEREPGFRQPEREESEEPDALAKLKAQYAENEQHLIRERQQRQDAERRAEANANAAVQGEKQYREATIAAVENAIALAKSNINQAQQAAAVAASRGDWDTHAKAVQVLTENSTQIASLERAKSDVERTPEPNVQHYRQPAAQADEFETQISGFPPRTQAWLREHKSDIYKNQNRAGLAEASARTAELKGIPVESDEYFAFINEQMGYQTVTKGNTQGGSVPPVARQKQAQTPAAPVGRTTFGNQGAKTRRVQLNQDQRRAAVQLYSHLPEHEALAEYAKGVAEIDSGKSNLLWSRDKYKGGAGV